MQNNWNIIHLCCWYGNKTLLSELINEGISLNVINLPDVVRIFIVNKQNGEPPVVLCCVMNDVDCLEMIINQARCLTDFEGDMRYRVSLEVIILKYTSLIYALVKYVSNRMPKNVLSF